MELKLRRSYSLSNKRSSITNSEQAFGLCSAIRDKGCSAPRKRALHPKFRLPGSLGYQVDDPLVKRRLASPKEQRLRAVSGFPQTGTLLHPRCRSIMHLQYLTPFSGMGFLIAGLILISTLGTRSRLDVCSTPRFRPTPTPTRTYTCPRLIRGGSTGRSRYNALIKRIGA